MRSASVKTTINVELLKSSVEEFGNLVAQTRDLISARDSQSNRTTLRATAESANSTMRSISLQVDAIPPSGQPLELTRTIQSFRQFSAIFKQVHPAALEKLAKPMPISTYSAAMEGTSTAAVHHAEPSFGTQSSQQDLEQIDAEIEHNNLIIQDRQQSIHQIQTKVEEVNIIFKDLAEIINEQAPLVDNIEHNIEVASRHTDRGVQELVAAEKSSKRSFLFF
ncbi:hypothetical protein Pelo_13462 [Pelomyxa schiedti]|nr:hypothetical protein Pelo_13462 [Pelomyxa schiedti]